MPDGHWDVNDQTVYWLEERIKELDKKNEILLAQWDSENRKFKIMENDLLIKIDALEDQIHDLLVEIEDKD